MADARYVIDVAAEMSGEETVDELDALIEKLAAGGRKSDDFQRALQRVTADLDAAKVASAEAAAALAAGNDQYRVLESAAIKAAKAVERAQMAGKIDLGAAKRAGDAQAALDAYSASLRGLEVASAGATAKQAKLAAQVANLNKLGAHADSRLAALNQRYEKLGQAVSFLPGPLGAVAQQFVAAQRAGLGLTVSLGAVRAAMILTAVGALAGAGAIAGLFVLIAKKVPGADKLVDRLGSNIEALFEGVDWTPFLQALGVIVDMFGKANPLAEFFGIALRKTFAVVGAFALEAAYVIEAFALEVAIAAVKAYLFFKKYGDEIIAVIEGIAIAAGIFAVAWAVANLGVIAGLVAQAASWVAMGVAAAAAWLVAAAPAILVVAAIAAVGYAISQLILHWDEVVEGVKLIWADLTTWLGEQVQWFADLGRNLMMGLVSGITGAVSAVISAVSGAVTGAVDAAKSVLGIASPSKVFAEIGGYTVEGFTGAVDEGAGEAQGSMAALVAPTPAVAQAASSGAAGATGGAGGKAKAGVDLSGATLNFYGVKDAETHGASMLREAFTRLLEDDADSLSGPGALEAPA